MYVFSRANVVVIFVFAGLKAMVNTLLKSIRMLSDVLILTTFFLCVFALIGLQLFVGIMQWKCVRNPPDGWPQDHDDFLKYLQDDGKCILYTHVLHIYSKSFILHGYIMNSEHD